MGIFWPCFAWECVLETVFWAVTLTRCSKCPVRKNELLDMLLGSWWQNQFWKSLSRRQQDFDKRVVLRREWKTPWEMSTTGPWSMIRAWRWTWAAGWWWCTKLLRNTNSRRKLAPQVRCGISRRAICDLETRVNYDGWRSVTIVGLDDRVDREGWTVMRSPERGEEDWRSLYAVEITLY